MTNDSLLDKILSCLEFPLVEVREETIIFLTNLVGCISENTSYISQIVFERRLLQHLTRNILAKDYQFTSEQLLEVLLLIDGVLVSVKRLELMNKLELSLQESNCFEMIDDL